MASKWANLDWDALAEDANEGMNGNGAQVEATHRAVASTTRMSKIMIWLTTAIFGFTIVIAGLTGAIAWWTYEMGGGGG